MSGDKEVAEVPGWRERKKREEWGQIGEGRLVVVVLVVLVVGGMRAPVPTPANPEVKQ